MRYLSVCSGIEAATQAWHPLGWEPVAFSEIEPFPAAVLAHHYPHVPNWGDMTKFQEWPDADVDLLVGGTPCQSFSVAGLRKGLADPRGNLALTYLAIAARYRPEWLVWENVPGVLSSGSGRDFGAFLGGLGQLGYGFAYRVLDAQYVRTRRFPRAVAQRRRRVFVVGHLGDWRRAAAVLFDSESLRGNPPPRRTARKATTYDVAPCLAASGRGVKRFGETRGQDPIVACDVADTLSVGANQPTGFKSDICAVAHALRGEGFDASEDGTGRGTPLVPAVANPLTARMHKGCNSTLDEGQTALPVAIAFNWQNGGGYGAANDGLGISIDHAPPNSRSQVAAVATSLAVRRLTPRECERLQGFPDDFTRIPWRMGYWHAELHSEDVRDAIAEGCPDGPRYKALGNSMAVNVMEWIGERING